MTPVANNNCLNNKAILTDNLKTIAKLCFEDHNFAQKLFAKPNNALKEVSIELDATEMSTLEVYLLLFSPDTSSFLYANSGIFGNGGSQPDESNPYPWKWW